MFFSPFERTRGEKTQTFRTLDGLKLDDPVAAFFDFCKERENIRLKRAQGKPGPWTKDEVFQNGRFLNVFREDDRGTKALLKECIEFMP